MSNSQTSKLTEIFRGDERTIVAYLFGSKSRGLQTPESDTDVAVLLSNLPTDMLAYYLDLIDKLSKAMDGSVDLVLLNTASPLLKHQVIKYGRVLYSRDEVARVEFEVKATKEYLDFTLRSDEYDEALMEELSKWRG